jgi:hypothetical protein
LKTTLDLVDTSIIILASTNLPIDLFLKCQLGKIMSLNVMALISK